VSTTGSAPRLAGAATLARDHLLPSMARHARILASVAREAGRAHPRWWWRRLPLLAVVTAVYLVWVALQWLGLLLDELLFPAYRHVAVRPVFIVGPPRSGTTLLHRTLALDEARFTTLRTWELLLAPSICARRLLLALAALDRALGAPAARRLQALERRLHERTAGIHALGLNAPEEDFLALLPAGACFLAVLALPGAATLWRLVRFDQEVPAAERTRILAFYRLCLQRHLYVFGRGRLLLSKNPSFSGWTRSLRSTFPDARFVVCLRDPAAALPSQVAALAPAWRLLHGGALPQALQERFIAMMRHYYEALLGPGPSAPPSRWARAPLEHSVQDLSAAVQRIYGELHLCAGTDFPARLTAAARSARGHRSGTHATLGTIGLDHERLAGEFSAYYESRAATAVTPAEVGCR